MPIEVFTHKLKNGELVKFSIWQQQVTSKVYYYARATSINTSGYKNLSLQAQEAFFGENVIFGKKQTIFYNNAFDLKNDLVTFYGSKWWVAEN